MRSIGLDLGARKIMFCEVANGQVLQRATVDSVEALKELLGPGAPKARVAIEACREAWHVHDTLQSWGHEVLVVDTTRIQQVGVGHHRRKNDRIDAEALARSVEAGNIPRAHVLSPERRELRMQLSVRRALVETNAQYVTTVRGLIRAKGHRMGSCSPEHFAETVAAAGLPEDVTSLCAPLLDLMEPLQRKLAEVEATIEKLLQREPIAPVLMSAPGVGVIVAAMFISVIDNADRFAKAHQVESYLGLVPSEDTTGGGKRKLGSITKAGNCYARSLLIQAAWQVLVPRGKNDPLKQWGEAVASRRGKRVAVVAIARRLAGILWAMWCTGTYYDPAMLARLSAEGLGNAADRERQRSVAMARVAKKVKKFEQRQRTVSREANA